MGRANPTAELILHVSCSLVYRTWYKTAVRHRSFFLFSCLVLSINSPLSENNRNTTTVVWLAFYVPMIRRRSSDDFAKAQDSIKNQDGGGKQD